MRLVGVGMLDGPRLLPRGCYVGSSQSKIRPKPFSSGSRLWNAPSYIPNLPSAHHVASRLQLDDGTSHDFGILVAADGLGSSVRNVVFPEYPKPHFTGLIGTGGITDAPVPDTGGVMRMTFGNNAFFGYLKAKGQPIYWFNSYAALIPRGIKIGRELLRYRAD